MAKKLIKVMDTSFRDGFQSVFGARVLTKDFMPAVAAAKEAGIKYFELTMNPDRPVLHRLYIQKANFYKKAELTPHPHKHEPRWLLRYDI